MSESWTYRWVSTRELFKWLARGWTLEHTDQRYDTHLICLADEKE